MESLGRRLVAREPRDISQRCRLFQASQYTWILCSKLSPYTLLFTMVLQRLRLGLRDLVGRLWHHFFRESTLPPHQAFEDPASPSHPEIESSKMTDPVDSAPTPSPAAAAPVPAPSQPATQPSSQQNLPIRDSKPAKDPAQKDKQQKGKDAAPAAAGTDAATAGGAKALTPAELKKKAKEEKAARRAKEKLEREQGGAGAAGGSAPSGGQGRPPATPKKDATGGGASQKGQKAPPPRRGSGPGTVIQTPAVEQKKKKDDKKVAVFGHLYGQQRRTTIAGAGKEVHPAVLALGLQLRDYVVCGSSARCVATLLAFKRVSLVHILRAVWRRILIRSYSGH